MADTISSLAAAGAADRWVMTWAPGRGDRLYRYDSLAERAWPEYRRYGHWPWS